jgi:hypothetical protein
LYGVAVALELYCLPLSLFSLFCLNRLCLTLLLLPMLLKLSQSLPLNTVTGSKEITEEKTKASSQKGPVLHKGRFSVTSDDVDLKVSISPDSTCCCGDVTQCTWCVECVVRELT